MQSLSEMLSTHAHTRALLKSVPPKFSATRACGTLETVFADVLKTKPFWVRVGLIQGLVYLLKEGNLDTATKEVSHVKPEAEVEWYIYKPGNARLVKSHQR